MRVMLICLLLMPGRIAVGQILSPGKLGAPHAQLEGLSRCTQCHALGKKIDGDLCLQCHDHRAVAQSIRDKLGLHGTKETQNKACMDCHRDHRGVKAPLSQWQGERNTFDHQKAGWKLEGKHAQAKCVACHESRRVVDEHLQKRLHRRELSTYLGLQRSCNACHFDEHRGQLGDACEQCHDAKAFKPAVGFDHQKVYALLGAHARTKCDRCHPTEQVLSKAKIDFPKPKHTDLFVRYKPIKKNCTQCHSDVHHGKFGQQCSDCHGYHSWLRTTLDPGDRLFHQKTSYALTGKHAAAPCKGCHPIQPNGGIQKTGFPFSACDQCHRDAHFGQMQKDKKGHVPCDKCHSVDGFYPSRFNIVDHQKGRFPLEGGHQMVGCRKCHTANPELFRKQLTPKERNDAGLLRGRRLVNFTRIKMPEQDVARCASCHMDPHLQQFKQTRCDTCHALKGFVPTTFSHSDSSQTDFSLTGKHIQLQCDACHPWVQNDAENVAVRWYRGVPRLCDGCHVNVHRSEGVP